MSAWLSFVLVLTAGAAFASNEPTPMINIEEVAGRNLLTEVRTDFDAVHGCYLRPPHGEVIQFLPEDTSSDKYQLENPIVLRGCRVTIKDIDQNDEGIWELYYTTGDGLKKASQYYNLSVQGGAIDSNEITQDDEEDLDSITTIEKDVGRDLLTEVRTDFDQVHGCYLRPPKGEVIQFLPEDTSGDKYKLENPIPLRGCRVTIKNIDQNDAGIWELYYTTEDTRLDKKGSQFYNVTVRSQAPQVETVNAVPSVIVVSAGRDVHVRLEQATPEHDTCVLLGPVTSSVQRDARHVDTCGFVVRNVTKNDAGPWTIRYGTQTKYEASVNVAVDDQSLSIESIRVLAKTLPLNVTMGPEDAVYCQIVNPFDLTVSEGFGPCNIVLDRVTQPRNQYPSVWKAAIGRVGRVLLENHIFMVRVETEPKAEVTTSVMTEKPAVMLSCQVESEHEISACKFRDPSGNVLLASQGVGEDRYSFHDTAVDLHSEVSKHQCSLRITNPVAEHLGLWRCAVQTQQDTYYGFLTVLWPWAMQYPAVTEAVVTEPILSSEVESVFAVEGDQVTLRCSVQSAIRYCYFRAQNGTVFNVNPGSSDWFEYVGAGLDSGECGVRFSALQQADSGRWSCHVGFHNQSMPEQRAHIAIQVQAVMIAYMFHHSSGFLVVRGIVQNRRPLEYCRFVRVDGIGFTSENGSFENYSDLSRGHCEIRVRAANTLERQPWTVVAKIIGEHFEAARSTEPQDLVPEQTERPTYMRPQRSNFAAFWTFILVVSLSLLLVSLMLGPRRNREWTYNRAVVVRESFRSRVVKSPPQPPHTTPISA